MSYPQGKTARYTVANMPAKSCLDPQRIKVYWSRAGLADKRDRFVPCGVCYVCRRKVVREWQGKTLMEQQFPYYHLHRDPDKQHFFTLTYATTPATEPKTHELGWLYDVNGEKVRWNGPFHEPKKKAIKRDEDGTPFYDKTPRRFTTPIPKAIQQLEGLHDPGVRYEDREYLTDEDLAYEHKMFLKHRCNWSDEQIKIWLNGEYPAMPTVRIADLQKFLKRLRITWQRRVGEDASEATARLRYVASAEYGDAEGRPHYHLSLFGLPREFGHLVHDCWEDYSGNGEVNGHVDPNRADTMFGESLMRGKAATYQAKDLVKSRHHFLHRPAMIGVERPRVIGSQKPMVGDGAFAWWFETHIVKTIELAEEKGKKAGYKGEALERLVVKAVRENYGVVHVPKGLGQETFPTSRTWRERVRERLQMDPYLWHSVTVADEHFDAAATKAYDENEEGLGDDVDKYRQQRKERTAKAQERERRRIEEKRSKLLAAGKLRSG